LKIQLLNESVGILDKDVPIGKREVEESDVDYLIPPGSIPYYEAINVTLPDLDQNRMLFQVQAIFMYVLTYILNRV